MTKTKIDAGRLDQLIKALERAEKSVPEIDTKNFKIRAPYRAGKTPEPVRWNQDDIKRKRA